MYGSCIFYPRSLAPAEYQWLLTLNPLVAIVEAFRFSLMGEGQIEISQWLISVAITLIIFFVGIHCVYARRKDICRYHLE